MLSVNGLLDWGASEESVSIITSKQNKKKLTGRPRKDVGFALECLHERGPDLGVALLCRGRVWNWEEERKRERIQA